MRTQKRKSQKKNPASTAKNLTGVCWGSHTHTHAEGNKQVYTQLYILEV